MKYISSKQVGLVSTLLHKAGLKETRQDVAKVYSEGRTEHISELYQPEAFKLITWLQKQAGQEPTQTKRGNMIRLIYSKCREMHWVKDGNVDMAHLNNFCLTRTKFKKPFAEFTDTELQGLVTVIKKVSNDFLKGI